MTRSQSIDVLNDAYDFQQSLDAVLRRHDDTPDYSVETAWVPGDPLYERPSYHEGGQYVRHMFDLYDDHLGLEGIDHDSDNMRCWDCEVYWEGAEPCFVCGLEDPDHWSARERKFNYDFQHDAQIYIYSSADADFTRSLYRVSQERRDDAVVVRFEVNTEPFHDVVAWMRAEMRRMLDEELHRVWDQAFLGDGSSMEIQNVFDVETVGTCDYQPIRASMFDRVVGGQRGEFSVGFRRPQVQTARRSGRSIVDEWLHAGDFNRVTINGITIPMEIPTESTPPSVTQRVSVQQFVPATYGRAPALPSRFDSTLLTEQRRRRDV